MEYKLRISFSNSLTFKLRKGSEFNGVKYSVNDCHIKRESENAIVVRWLKGIVARDFLPIVFFMNWPYMGPWFTP